MRKFNVYGVSKSSGCRGYYEDSCSYFITDLSDEQFKKELREYAENNYEDIYQLIKNFFVSISDKGILVTSDYGQYLGVSSDLIENEYDLNNLENSDIRSEETIAQINKNKLEKERIEREKRNKENLERQKREELETYNKLKLKFEGKNL